MFSEHIILLEIPQGVGIPNLSIRNRKSLAEVFVQTQDHYKRVGFESPWVCYAAFWRNECVGTCGFKSPPTTGKTVEIAYFTFSSFERRGYATQMAQKLISIANRQDPCVKIIAKTHMEENPSTRILKKIGFAFEGVVMDPEDGNVWQWGKDAPECARKKRNDG